MIPKGKTCILNLKAGKQKLDGDKAEQLVRFRHNNDGTTYSYEYGMEDLGRMRTQREFLKALAKQTLKVERIFQINEFIDIADKYVETNLDFDTIKDYVPYIVEFDMAKLKNGTSYQEYLNKLLILEPGFILQMK